MAEGGINRRDDRKEEEKKIEEEEELYIQLEEVSLDEREREIEEEKDFHKKLEELSLDEREGAKCESCMREDGPRSERYERVRKLYGGMAIFFCFLCKMFVCEECLPKHKFHEGMKKERKENKGKGVFAKIKKRLQKVEREESEREGKRRKFVNNLVNETERAENFFSSHAVICDTVYVKHKLDQKDCNITGLCGLGKKSLVVCDCWNSCIKIFKLGSHVLQRYIRFVGSEDSEPCDVTEINLKQNSTEPNLVSGSRSHTSVTDRADPDKQCLIAVTLPGKRQIMYVDLSKKPPRTQNPIQTERECYSIQFHDDKIFTVCDGPGSDCSVYVYSTDGDTLNKFDIDIYTFLPDFAVVSGRVYITDCRNDKVQCRNFEGQLMSEIKIEDSEPLGISVDPDNNVYVCSHEKKKVYKLDADLTRYKSVLDQATDYIGRPWAMCYYRDKLFISHHRPPSLENFVTVVRLNAS